jgi:prepilin-type N-terminal cleavage/methylation domain-containing protein
MRDAKGFTTIELIIVVIMIGVIASIGLPRLRDGLEKQNRRSMRGALVTFVSLARNSAVARGCRSSVHFLSGGNSKVWVTTCRTSPPGSTARDTIAGPELTEERWGHRLQSGRDSINFDARGLRMNLVATTIKIRTKGDADRDSVVVNAVGKVVYP